MFQLHSPLDMRLVALNNDEVSSSTETLPGGTYRRYGELQYISVPAKVQLSELLLTGEAYGSFSLDIERWSGDVLENRISYSGIPSSISTEVSVDLTRGLRDPGLKVDYDGNGIDDVVFNLEGEVVDETSNNSSSGNSKGNLLSPISKAQALVLGASTTLSMTSEQYYLTEMLKLLSELSRLLKLWEQVI